MTSARFAAVGDYPSAVWYLAVGGAITAAGSSMVIPLFTLFFTDRFDVGLATAGSLAALFFLGGMLGQALGGHLADVIGRRPVMLASILGGASTSLCVGFLPTFELIVPTVALFGMFAGGFRPAGGAMVADLVPAERRAGAFAILRVAFNAGFAVGPALAGLFLAIGRDASGVSAAGAYRPLFVIDAATSITFGLLVALKIRESLPIRDSDQRAERTRVAGGYRTVLANRRFVAFAGMWVLVMSVYAQLFSTVGPFVAGAYGFPVERFAALLSVNAIVVVLAQLAVTRLGVRLGLARTLFVGASLQGLGLVMLLGGGEVTSVVIVIVVFTFGEMLVAPTADAVVSGLADETNRGRYLALFTMAAGSGMALGPVLGGLLVDLGLGAELWLSAGVVSVLAGMGLRRLVAGQRSRQSAAPVGAPTHRLLDGALDRLGSLSLAG